MKTEMPLALLLVAGGVHPLVSGKHRADLAALTPPGALEVVGFSHHVPAWPF